MEHQSAGDDFIVLNFRKRSKKLVAEARMNEAKQGKKTLTFVTKDNAFLKINQKN